MSAQGVFVGARRRILPRLGWRPRGRSETIGAVVLVAMVLAVFVLPQIVRLDPYTIDVDRQLLPPSPEHPFGTDNLGRDYFARVLLGGRASILIAVIVVAAAGLVGAFIGALAGYLAGAGDELLMRTADVFLAFPSIMLALVVAGALGPSLVNAAIAIAIAWWPVYARIVRGQVISVRDRDFVTAARTLGASPSRILFGSVLPNSLSALKQVLLLDIGYAIIAVATLSYFGLGIQAPEPEWGALIRAAAESPGGWWMIVLPGLAIIIFAAALNFAGSSLTATTREKRLRG